MHSPSCLVAKKNNFMDSCNSISFRSTGKSILLDEKEEERLRSEMEEKIRQYREFRESVLQQREADRIGRNLEKEQQLQEYEDMQVRIIYLQSQNHSCTNIIDQMNRPVVHRNI